MSLVTGARQIAIITIRAKIKNKFKDNAITVAWHSQLSFDPYLYGIIIGKTRYSYELINKSKIFCVNFISSKLKDLALFFGRTSGRNINKLEKVDVEKCKKIDCLKLKNALAWLECKVIKKIDVGDHCLFVGEVLNEEINKNYKIEKEKRIFHVYGNFFKIF